MGEGGKMIAVSGVGGVDCKIWVRIFSLIIGRRLRGRG